MVDARCHVLTTCCSGSCVSGHMEIACMVESEYTFGDLD